MDIKAAVVLGLLVALAVTARAQSGGAVGEEVARVTVQRLVTRFGQAQETRASLGVAQVAQRWRAEDGDNAAFSAFCEEQFVAEPKALADAFSRLQTVLEQVDGHLHEVRRELLTPQDLDTGPLGPVDRLLANLDLGSHVTEDLFRTKVAFFALLNFPVHTLRDRLEQGPRWSREEWARSRMMDRFAVRVPPEVVQQITRATSDADRYIAEYNVRMDRLVTPQGERLFPDGLRLITHWGLRDELKSHYATSDGLRRQRMIVTVMERVVRQEIPLAVIDNPDLLWCPDNNEVRLLSGAPAEGSRAAREPDRRYEHILRIFAALRAADPYSPTAPTAIERAFELQRQIPEAAVEKLLVSVLASPEVRDTAVLISRRLGRPLEPFDIWYDGFKTRPAVPEGELDRLVAAKYPTAAAFQSGLPDLLQRLGFAPERARWLAERIVVDPSRGAGHAMGAQRREDKAHLRTRVAGSGMNYKGYNIAVHELGHNVEEVFSLNGIDQWFLAGVPNSAFTEAFAFVFQARDLVLLGFTDAAAEARRQEALADLWGAYEIAGVSLVDTRMWHWLYAHPAATPAQLREAVLTIARQVWNEYFAPVLGTRDQDLLAIYSHMVAYPLYLPDYPLGHIIAFQVAAKLRSGDFGAQFERMARLGSLTPDAWMRAAVGQPISTDALLAAAREALGEPRK